MAIAGWRAKPYHAATRCGCRPRPVSWRLTGVPRLVLNYPDPACNAEPGREGETTLIALSIARIEGVLLIVIVGLVGCGILAISLDGLALESFWLDEARSSLVRLFSLDQEANIPTWYASAALILASALAFLLSRAGPQPDGRRWALIGLLLLLMSIDESAVMHEMMIKPLRRLFDTPELLHYPWIVPAGFVAVGFALHLLPFVWRQPPPVRWRIMLGGALFLIGALGVEAISGLIEEVRGRERLYYMTVVVEESLEKLGVLCMISACLRRVALLPNGLGFAIGR